MAPTPRKVTRPDGTTYWRARVDVAMPGGARRQQTVRGHSRRQVEAEVARVRAGRDRGEPVARTRDTVADLLDAYLVRALPGRDEAARLTLRNTLRLPRERLGGRLARTVTPDDIAALVADALTPGRVRRRDEPAHQRRAALADAVRAAGPHGARVIDLAARFGGDYTFTCQGLARLARAGVIQKLARGRYAALPGDDGTVPTSPAATAAGQARPGYAASSVRTMVSYLRAVFAQAVADGKLARNPCDGVRVPAPARRPADERAWTEPQCRAFLAAADADRLAACWHLSALGLRRGEVLGLRWPDLDLGAGTVTIARSRVRVPGPGRRTAVKATKSGRGERVLPLDAATVAALAARRSAERREQLAAGPAWHGTGGYVAVDALGRPVEPSTYSRLMGLVRDRAGLPPLPAVHNPLRHTLNTLMAAAGVPAEVRHAWCGHTAAVNAGVYTHALPADLGAAAAVVAGLS
jgi:integrase